MTTSDKRAQGGPPPERSATQRRDALERANEIRRARAKLKRVIHADRSRAELIKALRLEVERPELIEGMAVADLLRAGWGIGRVKVRSLMRSIDADLLQNTTTLRRIHKTPRRLDTLIAAVEEINATREANRIAHGGQEGGPA